MELSIGSKQLLLKQGAKEFNVINLGIHITTVPPDEAIDDEP
jgi:hypothetical protein